MSASADDSWCACSGRERVQPAVDELAAKAEPTAKDVTHGVIRPGGAAFAEHAVPATKAVASERIEPAVDAVRVLDTCCTG